jgi:TPR repeat protein
VNLLTKAANQFGHFQAMYLLGKVYLNGPLLAADASEQDHIAGGMAAQKSRSCELGVHFMRRAALVASWGSSLRRGFDAFLERDMESALLYYSEASELGYPRGAANAAWLTQSNKEGVSGTFMLWGNHYRGRGYLLDGSGGSEKRNLPGYEQENQRTPRSEERKGEGHSEKVPNSKLNPLSDGDTTGKAHGGGEPGPKDHANAVISTSWLALRHLDRAVWGAGIQSQDYDAFSQLLTGDFWFYGQGGKVDKRKAMQHWALASGKGNWRVGALSRSQASYNLGWMYELGLASESNDGDAHQANEVQPSEKMPNFARFEIARRYYQRALSQLSQADLNKATDDPTNGYASVAVQAALWRLSARESLERRASDLDGNNGKEMRVYFDSSLC